MAEITAVEADVIVFGETPLSAGEIFIVDLALAVFVHKSFFGALVCHTVKLNYSSGFIVFVGVDEHIKAVVSVFENVVGTSANNDAVAFFCKLLDDSALS